MPSMKCQLTTINSINPKDFHLTRDNSIAQKNTAIRIFITDDTSMCFLCKTEISWLHVKTTHST